MITANKISAFAGMTKMGQKGLFTKPSTLSDQPKQKNKIIIWLGADC